MEQLPRLARVQAKAQGPGAVRSLDVPQQVARPERAVHEPLQGHPARLDGGRNGAAPVDGHVDQEAGLLVLVDLLHERHHARGGGQPAVAGSLHGRPAHWLGEHVVADRRLVATIQRLQVHDGVVLGTGRRRADGELGSAATAHRHDDRVPVGRGDPPAEADALHAGIAPAQLESVHERL
jgi:hypothetical protein